MSSSAVLELLGEVYPALELPEFRLRLLRGLQAVVPCDWVSLNDVSSDPEEEIVVLVEPDATPAQREGFSRLAHQNPLVVHFSRTGDGRPRRFSDVIEQAAYRELEIYRELYAEMGVEHQIAFTLPAPRGHLLGVAISRRHPDFTDAERDLLDQARPFLIQGYRNAIAHTRLRVAPLGPGLDDLQILGLTSREAEVVVEFAAGRSAVAVGEQLDISPRTVQKHLQRAYRKLGVTSRSAARAVLAATLGG